MSERLKNPEDYMEKFFELWKEGKTIVAAPWIEKKKAEHLQESGWYELQPFEIDLGTWSKNEDSLSKIDIATWNKKSLELATSIENAHRQDEKTNTHYLSIICAMIAASLSSLTEIWALFFLSVGWIGLNLFLLSSKKS